MASSNSYYMVGLIVPLIAMLLFYIGSGIAILTHIIRTLAKPDLTFKLPQAFQLLLKAVFLGLEIKNVHTPEEAVQSIIDPEKPISTDHSKDAEMIKVTEAPPTTVVYLHSKRLRGEVTYTLVFLVVALFGCSAATLWQVLLIESTTTCGEAGYDCFSCGERVTDCSLFENETTVSINGTDYRLECYRFCFNYVMAFAAAGGVTFFGGIMINTFTFAAIRLSKMEKPKYYKRIIIGITVTFMLLPIPLIATVVYVAHTLQMMDVHRMIIYSIAYGISVVANIFIYKQGKRDHFSCEHSMDVYIHSNEGRIQHCPSEPEQSTHVYIQSSGGRTEDT